MANEVAQQKQTPFGIKWVVEGPLLTPDGRNPKIAFAPRPLQDWPVPVIYEAAPLALFPKPKTGKAPTLKLDLGQTHPIEALDLPPPPDVGFYGRDETLLALDRAFDTQNIVLLHAFAGSGKTTAAAEFARWYTLTGGLQGPVLFTSFGQYQPLPRVLDSLGRVFGDALEQSGVHWLALSDEKRRQIALDVLRQIPVLWIWDNVEPVAGFPAGTSSAWSDTEQGELRQFLSEARDTKAKFLLTSRRDEQAWLGNLPRRIAVPPMPLQERVQLARALAEKFGHRITDVDDWRPLLHFTQGNPLTITVLVGQALRNGLKTRAQIGDAGDFDRALPHYRESIRYEEAQGNLYGAARTRFNVAVTLAQAGRLADAREYALAALRNFETYGDRTAADIEKTRRLIARIESVLQSQGK